MSIQNRKVRRYSVSVNPSTNGSNEVLPAATGVRYKVYGFIIVSTLANSVKFMSAATDISATWPLAATGGVVAPQGDAPWFSTVKGEALNVNLSASTATGVHVVYEVEQ